MKIFGSTIVLGVLISLALIHWLNGSGGNPLNKSSVTLLVLVIIGFFSILVSLFRKTKNGDTHD